MTANELADYLDNNIEAMIMSEQPYLDQAATMLRQQQVKIEALKKRCLDEIFNRTDESFSIFFESPKKERTQRKDSDDERRRMKLPEQLCPSLQRMARDQ